MMLSGMEYLDLSNNLIERIENLQFCYSLLFLDLGFNRIQSVHNTVESLGNLKFLVLRNNGLRSTLGMLVNQDLLFTPSTFLLLTYVGD
jgi:Leucine-rich repeat (LRR) protein